MRYPWLCAAALALGTLAPLTKSNRSNAITKYIPACLNFKRSKCSCFYIIDALSTSVHKQVN